MNNNVFESLREVKWCPGCGNYAILKTMQKTLQQSGIPNNKIVFISGIGCSGRFPYYINTFGFHTLHGRAPAVATGLKLSRPDLTIWVVIGDGDGFSIGLNHILHMVRRNVDIKVLFINNKIYALTKGQYSPTSDKGFNSKSSPYGSIEKPINPLLMILSAGCTFVARAIDNDYINLKSIIEMAMKHKGSAFIEILQSCNIFNHNIYSEILNQETNMDKLLFLNHGKELIFGKEKTLCLNISNNIEFEILNLNKNTQCIKHDIYKSNILQFMLAKLQYNDIPFPVGIFRYLKEMTFDENYSEMNSKSIKLKCISDLFK